VKPNLRVYNKLGLLCKNKSGLTISDDQLLVGGKWENVKFLFPTIPIKAFPFHFHSHETSLAIPIPMGIPWDPRDPWKFPIYTHLYVTVTRCYKKVTCFCIVVADKPTLLIPRINAAAAATAASNL